MSIRTGLFAALLSFVSTAQAGPNAVPGEFVMRTYPKVSIHSLAISLQSHGLKIKETLNAAHDTYRVKVSDLRLAQSDENVIDQISKLSDIAFIEPNYIYTIDMGAPKPKSGNPIPQNPPPEDNLSETIPNDTRFSELWAMKNTGQKDSSGRAGTPRADIRATKAWMLSKGSKDVVVAVIDTGVDYTHPDLKDNIWSMPGNPSVHGHNAIKNTDDPMDDNSHGTHCSGTIGGMGDNNVGVAGVNHHVSIMGVKFLDSQGSGALSDAVKAIDWATEHGAQVMSNSWGGGGKSQAMQDAIQRAADKGILFVAAAGNGDSSGNGIDNDKTPSYPASYAVANVVAVAASNNVDQMSKFSNYGAKTVHLMAPGEKILSTVPNNDYKVYSGTSMATPHVSGAAALLLSREPNLKAVQLKSRIVSSVYKIPEYKDRVSSGGRLDLYNLLSNSQ